MIIGEKILKLRESKELSQGDIEHRTGLRRHYISRVENGHTVPNLETLEKLARALQVPLYRFFYDGRKPPKKLELPSIKRSEPTWGAEGKELEELRRFAKAFSQMEEKRLKLLMGMAQRMAKRAQRTR